jgi:uncharacterized iron-regulated protein
MKRSLLVLFLSVMAAIAGCSDDEAVAPTESYDFSAVLSAYSEQVVVATYEDMKSKGAALSAAVAALDADPADQGRLDAAAAAWRAMREPWEASEAFLFGPADFLSLDPALDSWPVDHQQLDNVLASSFDLTPDFIRNGLGPALRGFHTVEYLLFRDGAPRTAGDVTAREREYLLAATQVLATDAAALADAWSGGFADEFARAGKSGSRYASQIDAVTEIINGMSGILDEVANGKVADPVTQQDVRLVESQFSWNSITDFQNNIRSARNAYLGGYHLGSDGVGLNVFVAEQDASLDARLQDELDDAIAALAAIPAPFELNLDATAPIEAAQEAMRKVQATLEEDVKPLLTR